MTHLALVELKLLLRKRITALSVLAVPAVLIVFVLTGLRPGTHDQWGHTLASQVVLLTIFSTYLVSLTVFTARRQSLVLKRLRTSSLSDREIIAGVLGPVVVVALAQVVVYLGVCVALDAPAPESPLVVLVGLVLALAIAIALGVATACLSRSVEVTQVTGTPVTLAAMIGMFLTATSSPWAAGLGLAMPLSGPADLVARGWTAGVDLGTVPVVPLDMASVVLWLTVAGTVISRSFRWEPRT